MVNLQGVSDVMAILERYPITKEHLEVRVNMLFLCVLVLAVTNEQASVTEEYVAVFCIRNCYFLVWPVSHICLSNLRV